MARLVRPTERRAIEILDAEKRRKKRFGSSEFNYAAFNAILPPSDEERQERQKAQNLLLALFTHESEQSRREREGIQALAAALGLEIKPRAPRIRW